MKNTNPYLIALALLVAAAAALAVPFDPDSVEEIKGQKRYSYVYDHGDYSELDSINLATHYTQEGRGDTLFAFENTAGGDTIFTLLTTEGETLHVGKVDTVYGEGYESGIAWKVLMNGVMQEGVPKIRTIVEERAACDTIIGMLLDADTSYHDLGDESFHNIYYEGGSELDVRWTAWVYPGILTWNIIPLTIEEMQSHPLPAVNKILPFPNPFNSAVTIVVDCHSRESGNPERAVTVEIFDIAGRRVAQLTPPSPPLTGGEGEKSPLSRGDLGGLIWQPDESLGSGVYLVRITMGDETATRRVVYLK